MSFAAALSRLVVPKRRWFQFSLRTFLVLLTAFGGWLGLHLRSVNRQKAAVAAIEAYGGSVYYDFQEGDGRSGLFNPGSEPKSWVPHWLVARTGLDFFHDVVFVNLFYNDDFRRSRRLSSTLNARSEVLNNLDAFPDLRTFYLRGSQVDNEWMKRIGKMNNLEELGIWDAFGITDRGTHHLKNLTNLKRLTLSYSSITDESLNTFSGLPRLEDLSLQGGAFSDNGLAYLKDMTQLKSLYLGLFDNQITDEGLVHLKGLTSLEELELQESQVTAKGLEHLAGLKNLKAVKLARDPGDLTRLRQGLPNCKVTW